VALTGATELSHPRCSRPWSTPTPNTGPSELDECCVATGFPPPRSRRFNFSSLACRLRSSNVSRRMSSPARHLVLGVGCLKLADQPEQLAECRQALRLGRCNDQSGRVRV
jgi:hypothetical protein